MVTNAALRRSTATTLPKTSISQSDYDSGVNFLTYFGLLILLSGACRLSVSATARAAESWESQPKPTKCPVNSTRRRLHSCEVQRITFDRGRVERGKYEYELTPTGTYSRGHRKADTHETRYNMSSHFELVTHRWVHIYIWRHLAVWIGEQLLEWFTCICVHKWCVTRDGYCHGCKCCTV